MRCLLKKTAAAFLAFSLLALSADPEAFAATARAASVPRLSAAAPIAFSPLSPVNPALLGLAAAKGLAIPPTVAPSLTSAAPAPATQANAARQLSLGADLLLSASEPGASAESSAAGLGVIFDDQASRQAIAELSLPSGPSAAPSSLAGASSRSAPDGLKPPAAARQSLACSARVGFVAAVISLAISQAGLRLAPLMGHQFHSSNPFAMIPATAAALAFLNLAFMAPVAEEMLFRGGLMGGIRRLTSGIPLGKFWIPAALSSAVFVAAHEVSDPVLFGLRFAAAMIFSYAFHREGFAGSIFAHGFFNGLLFLPVMFMVLLPVQASLLAMLALPPVSLLLAWRAYKRIRAESIERESGRLVPYEISAAQANILSIALLANFLLGSSNLIWILGALGWTLYARKRPLDAP